MSAVEAVPEPAASGVTTNMMKALVYSGAGQRAWQDMAKPVIRDPADAVIRIGGWILGNTIDGTHAEYVRTPHADTSLYHLPKGADEEGFVMLSDILPTAFECGVLNGKVRPGDTVADNRLERQA